MELNIWVVAIVGGLQCLLIGSGIVAMLWGNRVRSKQQDENSAALKALIEEGRESRAAFREFMEENRESRAAFRDFIDENRESRAAFGDSFRELIEEGRKNAENPAIP